MRITVKPTSSSKRMNQLRPFQSIKSHDMKRTVVKIRKKAKNADKLYNMVSNPITLFEITSDDLPDLIPYNEIIHHVVNQIPCFDIATNIYDSLSFKKDLAETVWKTYTKSVSFPSLQQKEKILSLIKFTTLIYKIWILYCISSGIPKSHDAIVSCLDYLNFLISSIEE